MTMAIVAALSVGFLIGVVVGIFLLTRASVDKTIANVSRRVMLEHRAYRLALAELVGSAVEADRIMTTYREKEEL